MIKFEHVSMSYIPGEDILHDISLELKKGSFHFLTGKSGSGKSTLLSLLWMQRRAAEGRIYMFGQDVSNLPRENLPQLRRKVGIVLQDYRLLEHLTIGENVGLPLKVIGESPKDIEAKVRELMAWMEIPDYYDAYPRTLSGGQKQRAAIARAVVTNPEILLADEPTGNLDSELAIKFMYLFEQLNKMGTTILFATHDQHLVSSFDYPVLRLKNGKLT